VKAKPTPRNRGRRHSSSQPGHTSQGPCTSPGGTSHAAAAAAESAASGATAVAAAAARVTAAGAEGVSTSTMGAAVLNNCSGHAVVAGSPGVAEGPAAAAAAAAAAEGQPGEEAPARHRTREEDVEECGPAVLSPPRPHPRQTLADIQDTLRKAAGAHGTAAAAAAAAGGDVHQAGEEELDGAHKQLGLLLVAGEETGTVPLVLRLFERVRERVTDLLAVSDGVGSWGGGARQSGRVCRFQVATYIAFSWVCLATFVETSAGVAAGCRGGDGDGAAGAAALWQGAGARH
jgi:hypothetical protein